MKVLVALFLLLLASGVSAFNYSNSSACEVLWSDYVVLNETFNDLLVNYSDLDDDFNECEDSLSESSSLVDGLRGNLSRLRIDYAACNNSLMNCDALYSSCKEDKVLKAQLLDSKEELIQTLKDDKVSCSTKIGGLEHRASVLLNESDVLRERINSLRTEKKSVELQRDEFRRKFNSLSDEVNYMCRWPVERKNAYFDNYRKLNSFERRCLKGMVREKKISFITAGRNARNDYTLPRLCSSKAAPVSMGINKQLRTIHKFVELGFVEAYNCPQELDENLAGESQQVAFLASCEIKPKQLDYGCLQSWDEWLKYGGRRDWAGFVKGGLVATLSVLFYMTLKFLYHRHEALS